jgi:hypothetical protein
MPRADANVVDILTQACNSPYQLFEEFNEWVSFLSEMLILKTIFFPGNDGLYRQ